MVDSGDVDADAGDDGDGDRTADDAAARLRSPGPGPATEGQLGADHEFGRTAGAGEATGECAPRPRETTPAGGRAPADS